MLVKVKLLTGRELEIDIEPYETLTSSHNGPHQGQILSIKERIEEREGVPPSQQREESLTASSCKIEGGTVLHLVLTLRGGL
ncbi:hypothetical protein H696_04837 [Fonticula alba]|uniref:Ubiquitin-like domain-containing protein n=1 Tax=Fonticula alba TaxID=691883 RepID=A0A058Z2S5_FONAL|nr:hypothetical protein H696_04837 [Fonticula alba]KCV68545.1 hypothetical protein H696_04837 [Fonticula alba]|eukprot:XP_009496977.1 hypothetical protein H696_04837 [Fonticula alba]